MVRLGVNVSQCGVRFPKGQYFPVLALKVTSRKSVWCIPASMVIQSLLFRNNFLIFFFSLSVSSPEVLGRKTRPLSLYRPTDSLVVTFASSSSK